MKKNPIFFFGFLLFLQFLFVGGAWGQVTVTLTGSGTWYVPNGVTSITVKCWGAGGAGGGSSVGNTSYGGAGGGSGGYTFLNINSLSSGASFNYSIGAGGTGVSSANGNNGGATTFSSTSLGISLLANGGSGGGANNGAAGSGGTASGGSTNTSGSLGNAGGTNGGAGGTNSETGSGSGGSLTSNASGNAGSLPGGGGGGGEKSNSTGSVKGGDGGAGTILITYICPTISTFPFIESFEGISSGIPSCWGLSGTTATGSAYHFNSFATGQTGKGLRFNSFNNSSGNTSELTTPTLDLSSLTTAELKFYFKNPTGGNFEVLISTNNGSTYTSLQTSLTSQTSWMLKTYTITSYISSTVKIKFKGTSNYGTGDAYVYLDEILIQAIPTCFVPTALTSSTITTQSATISWTAPTTGTAPAAYDYEVRTSGAAGSGATGLVTSGSITAPSVSAAITGLTGATAYSYYVRSNCGGGDFSAWTSAGTFITACDIPSNPGAISVSGSSSTGFTLTYAAASPVPTSYVLFNTTGISTAATTIPSLVNGTTYSSGTAYTLGGTSYNCTSSSSTSPQSLSGGVSNTQYNYFLFSRNATNSCSGNPYYSSGITVSAITCPAAPTSPVNTLITASGATISWSASVVGGGYGTINYSLEVYTDVSYTTAISGSPFSMGTNVSQVLNGLAGSTTYYYRIVATNGVCNSGFLTGSFTTLCIAEIAPTSTQTFATFTGSAPSPICWTEASSSSVTTSTTLTVANSEWLNSTGFANTGSNVGVKTNLYETDSDDWLISNQIDLGNTAGVYRLKYDMAVTSYNGIVSQSTIGTHIVRVIISTDGGTTWSSANTLKTYTGTGTYSNTGVTEYINLSNYSGIIKIAFVATTSSTSPDIDFHLDNFAVETIPPPSITSFTPSQACVIGGQILTITGTNFNTITSVLFAGSSGTATLNGTIVSQTATTVSVVIPPNFVDGTIKIVNAFGNGVSATNLIALALPTASVSSSAICSGNNAVFAITGTANAVVTYNLNSGSNTTVTLDGSGNGSVTVTAPSTNQTINLVSVNLVATGCTKTLGTSATITLNAVTSITTQPSNQSAQIGSNAQFNVVVAGSNLTYQWQEFDGTTYSNISGATSSTLTISSVIANDNGRVFRCVVSGTCGFENTSNATLTASSIGITTQPADVTICNSGSTTLSLVTSGTITNYQWQISTDNQTTWTDISGETNATLALSGLSYSSPAKVYRCNLNNGTLYTNGATVTVYDQIAITSQPTTQTICTGTSSVSFSVTASGSNPTYQWQVSTNSGTTWANVASGGTGASYTLSNPADALNASQYRVIVTGSSPCTAVTSNAVTLNVIYTSIASSVSSGCINSAFTLTATLNGNPTNPTYSWACPTTGSGATTAITSNPASITPTATGTFIYTLTAGSTECPTVTKTINYVVNALPTITSATATPITVCSGASIALTGSSVPSSSGNSSPSGSGTSYTSSTGYPTFFGNYYYQDWSQILYTASELSAMGLVSSNLTALKINVGALPSPATVNGYSIRIGTTNNSSLSSFQTTGLTTVFNPGSYSVASTGNITITFSTPFYWDGVSNILVDIRGTGQYSSANATINYTNTSPNTVVYAYTSSNNTSFWTSSPTPITSTLRPNIVFSGQIGTNQTSSLTWSWNSTPTISLATGTTTETNTSGSATTKTYTVTATNASTGCVNTATTSAITINPATIAPTATNSSQCGTATPTCSVSGTGTSGNTFKWYTVASGGAALTGQTASTLTSYPVSATTSFYVSEFNGTCESQRVQVTASVTAAPTITATASVNPVCSGSATSLTATSANSGYSYSWSNGAGTGASVSVNPTSATTYTVTGTDNSGGANNGCVSSATIAVTINALPTAITLTPTTSTNLCMGDVKTIVASGGNGATTNPVSIFNENFEISSGSFTAQNASTAVLNNTYYSQGSSSVLFNTAAATATKKLTLNSNIDLTNCASATLTFSHIAAMEGSSTTYDYGFVEYSTDGGTNWVVFPVSSYVGTASNTVFSGTDVRFSTKSYTDWTSSLTSATSTPTNLLWKTEQFNVPSGALTNQFKIRFSYYVDGSTYYYGWLIDNVIVNKNLNSIVWSPSTALFTDAAATTAYTGTPSTVYAKPTSTTTYTATATTAAGCTSSASVSVNVAAPSTQTVANNDFVWRGTASTAWSTASNWVKFDGTTYAVASTSPVATDNVFIPQNNTCVVNQPSIGAGTVSAKAVYIEPSATVTGGSGSLDVKGNFTNNGTFTAGTGTVSFSGTTAQQITGATTFYNLTENNSTGLTLNSPVMVSNGLTMTAGDITTSSSNLLTLGNSASATLAWTSGKVVGPMKRWMAATTNSGAASSMFPLGNTTRNTQASIEYTTAPTTAGYLEAKFIAATPATAATNAYATLTDQFNYVLDNVVSEGYWEINPSATSGVAGGTYTVKLEGEAISLATSTNASYTDVRVIKSPDPHTSWILQGDHGAATGTNSDFTVSRTGMSGYSYFAMAFPSAAPLPIELVSFAANCEDNNTVAVNWTTASEHNSDYYTVEKSRDGTTWNELKTIPAAGNSTQLINYTVSDASDINGTVYYRLTQVDVDGASKMYDIVSTNCIAEKELTLLAYPNPSNGQFSLKIENAKVGKYELSITDMQGKTIDQQSLDLESGTTVVKLNPANVQPGVYMLELMQDGYVLQYQKLVIE